MKEIVNPVERHPAGQGIFPVWDKQSRILLVGSMTAADGLKKGFYYSSARNQLWELLDFCLGLDGQKENSFLALKNDLKSNYEKFDREKISKAEFETEKTKIREKFANLLKKYKIAMCDVFESCFFNNNSSLDCEMILNNDKYPFKTYKDTLQKIVSNANIECVIVNSRFVENQFKKMKLEGDFVVHYVISPSPRRGSIESKKQEWKNLFDKFL